MRLPFWQAVIDSVFSPPKLHAVDGDAVCCPFKGRSMSEAARPVCVTPESLSLR